MAQLVLDTFERVCAHVAIDARLAQSVQAYQMRFVTKNPDHIEFFGGHLLGVNPVKFLPSDEDVWFEEILQSDKEVLTQGLADFKMDNNDRVVSSDTMNLSCLWLAHKFLNAALPPEVKEQAMVACMLVLQYKFLTSRLYRHFGRYTADPSIAEATYAQLSYKFAIKQYGSWSAYFRARAETIINRHEIHYQRLVKFAPDNEVVYMVNDIQGRIREMLKALYGEYLKVMSSGAKIHTSSNTVEFDGESILKDTTQSMVQYRRYLDGIVADRNTFIRDQLVELVLALMSTADPRLVRTTLFWMSSNYRQKASTQITEVLDECLIHAFSYLNEERAFLHGKPHLETILSRLKGVYTSSRSTDPKLMVLRQKMEQLVTLATGNKSPAALSATRTTVLLYLVARTFTMHYFG